ncbi:MAG: restriction endonuclease [Thermofilaceae archaeon]
MTRRKVRRVKRVARRRSRVTPHEKGRLFEDVIEKYFQLLGFMITRNARIQGFSGAVHEVDVLIEKNGVKGVVEAKNYSRPIPKEWIMKASSVAKDIGATDVYVVSASGFTDDAVKVAEVLGVKLLNLDDMVKEVKKRKLDEHAFHVKPSVPEWKARKSASRYVSKVLFISTEEIGEAEVVYIPHYAIDVEYTYTETSGIFIKKTLEKKTAFTLLANALDGSLVTVCENGVVFRKLAPVSKEQADLLNVLKASEEGLTEEELARITGARKVKLAKMLSKLVENGLVKYVEVRDSQGRTAKKYYTLVPTVEELMSSKTVVPEAIERGAPSGTIIEPKVPPSHVASVVNTLYRRLNIVDARLIYLPIYRVKLVSTKDGSYRYIYLTGHTEEPMTVSGFTE